MIILLSISFVIAFMIFIGVVTSVYKMVMNFNNTINEIKRERKYDADLLGLNKYQPKAKY